MERIIATDCGEPLSCCQVSHKGQTNIQGRYWSVINNLTFSTLLLSTLVIMEGAATANQYADDSSMVSEEFTQQSAGAGRVYTVLQNGLH